MNGKCLSDDERKKIDKEFSEFLIGRINQAGGSLQFQHISALLTQARFEIRDVYGTRKSELMKFLRGHPKTFQIDSVGVLSLVKSSVSDDSSDDCETSNNNDKRKKKLTKIENGVGHVVKIHPEFGIIEASQPIEAQVHFKSEAFSNDKDSILSDCCLEVRDEVYFNAVYAGHEDFEIQFRASKVWLKLDGSAQSDRERHDEHTPLNNLESEGVIRLISPEIGFIRVLGDRKEEVFFHKSHVKNCNATDLTKFFRVNDLVSFSAKRNKKKDAKAQWEAVTVEKKSSKESNRLSSTHTKAEVTVKKKIENERGKICTHSRGAIIKFGENFSERADGDSSLYFLYGSEVLVADIAFEFSDGDEVYFDAIPTKSAPGWKAVLVWVGDKPSGVCNKIVEKEMDNFSENKNSELSDTPSESNNSSFKSKEIKNILRKDTSLAEQMRGHKKSSEFPARTNSYKNQKMNFKASKKFCQKDASLAEQVIRRIKVPSEIPACTKSLENKKMSFTTAQNLPNPSRRKSKGAKNKSEHQSENFSLNKNKSNKPFPVPSEAEERIKPEKKNFQMNNCFGSELLSHNKSEEISNLGDEDYDYQLYCMDDTSEEAEDKHLQKKMPFFEDSHDDNLTSSKKYDFSDCDESDLENTDNEKKCFERNASGKASIKKFEDIDGEVIDLYCKAAIIKSSHLQKNIDFVLNAFYLNGKSVEEQQVIDLKEIITVGDAVKFNCFEITDDFGNIHQKVTMAWKGPKPKVYEMTPDEFINEYELSVTVSNEVDSNCISVQKTVSSDSLASAFDDDKESDTESSDSASSIFNSFSDDEEEQNDSRSSETRFCRETEQSSDMHKDLSEIILQQLKDKGLISTDMQVDLCSVMTKIIDSVQHHYSNSRINFPILSVNAEENSKCVSKQTCLTCQRRKDAISAAQNKLEKNTQTIFTGGIVAQNESF